MSEFNFYLREGLWHVLDLNAYDHILFLVALALPFSFKQWKSVLVLATLFTIAHCTSLALSTFEIYSPEAPWVEFLIPLTIALTAVFNLVFIKRAPKGSHYFFTIIFGLIHGFGFSNYFKMMMAEETEKISPLLGFAAGIEVAQVTIILLMLFLIYLLVNTLRMPNKWVVIALSSLIIFITIPMMIDTWPI